jgi:hypothetical protein
MGSSRADDGYLLVAGPTAGLVTGLDEVMANHYRSVRLASIVPPMRTRCGPDADPMRTRCGFAPPRRSFAVPVSLTHGESTPSEGCRRRPCCKLTRTHSGGVGSWRSPRDGRCRSSRGWVNPSRPPETCAHYSPSTRGCSLCTRRQRTSQRTCDGFCRRVPRRVRVGSSSPDSRFVATE